jgi:cadmium resistance protein CadD (predicted permease)
MACILTLMGSVLGFFSALVALLLFQVPFMTALAIWGLVGFACVALGLTLAMAPAAQDDQLASQELA